MVLDTETTGFANYPKEVKAILNTLSPSERKREKEKPEYLKYKSHIIQLSYIVYDLDAPNNSKIFDKYIYLDPETGKTISKGATRTHGIDYIALTQKLTKELSTIEDAMDELLKDMELSDLIVGHNISYDKERLIEELQRIKDSTVFNVFESHYNEILDQLKTKYTYYCTLKQTKELRKKECIPGKQAVVYKYFFGYEPDERAQHNSLFDVIMCLRIYMMHAHDRDICGENDVITQHILSFSPEGYKCPNTVETFKDESLNGPSLNGTIPSKPSVLKRLTSCLGSSCKKVVPIGGKTKNRRRKRKKFHSIKKIKTKKSNKRKKRKL
jgi:DNA polymerase III epsilon subunit-like protein